MRTIFLLFPLLFWGCTTPGGPQAVREPLHRPAAVRTTSTSVEVNMAPDREVVTEVVKATPEAAWAALQTAYEELGIPIKEMNADLKILGNPKFVLSRRLNRTRLSTYLDCGYGPSGNHADSHRIEMQLRTSVLSVEGGVRVNTFLAAVARNMDGTSNTAIRCASKFRLEQEIAGRVKFYAEGG